MDHEIDRHHTRTQAHRRRGRGHDLRPELSEDRPEDQGPSGASASSAVRPWLWILIPRGNQFDLGLLATKGSLYLTRPSLFTYVATRDDLLASATARRRPPPRR